MWTYVCMACDVILLAIDYMFTELFKLVKNTGIKLLPISFKETLSNNFLRNPTSRSGSRLLFFCPCV